MILPAKEKYIFPQKNSESFMGRNFLFFNCWCSDDVIILPHGVVDYIIITQWGKSDGPIVHYDFAEATLRYWQRDTYTSIIYSS